MNEFRFKNDPTSSCSSKSLSIYCVQSKSEVEVMQCIWFSSLVLYGYYIYRQVWRSEILRSAHTVYLCVLCGSQSVRNSTFHYTFFMLSFQLLYQNSSLCCMPETLRFPSQHLLHFPTIHPLSVTVPSSLPNDPVRLLPNVQWREGTEALTSSVLVQCTSQCPRRRKIPPHSSLSRSTFNPLQHSGYSKFHFNITISTLFPTKCF